MELAELTCVQNDKVRVNRKTLEAVLQQCLQQLACVCDDDGNADVAGELDTPQDSIDTSATSRRDTDTVEVKFYGLLKSRFECPDFITKLENSQALLAQNMAEEGSSWDMVGENDLWGGGNLELETEDYVLVRQEDIMEGIASFMAAYLLSLEQTKDMTPNQLQEALRKTFSLERKKGKLRKAWDGSKVIYNVASWGATAIGCILDFMPRAIKAIVRCISDSERPLWLDLTTLELTAPV
ncbi:hypothetical protein DH2020_040982 [Rehmannia glutinosa]|uniref:Uncharacterized protein n=1 Tax=Rehmannia glutinosa TaxID=99300 RepID=A0ABR0USL8_REHGL